MFAVSESYEIPQLHVWVDGDEEDEEDESGYVNLGSSDDIQELEDDGTLDQYFEDAPAGEGYWVMPKEWGAESGPGRGWHRNQGGEHRRPNGLVLENHTGR